MEFENWKFSKVSLLLDQLYTMTTELTFENLQMKWRRRASMVLENVWKLCKYSKPGERNSILTQLPVYTLQWSVFFCTRTVCCSYFYKKHLDFTVCVLATLVCFFVLWRMRFFLEVRFFFLEEKHLDAITIVSVAVVSCVCVCVRERERERE